MPGVVDFLGFDLEAEKWIHVHAHFKLIIGHDMSKNYHLPIEIPYISTSIQGDLFRVPLPEFEFILLIIRMVLKYCTWDAILGRQSQMKSSERDEFVYLQELIDPIKLDEILAQHFPYVDRNLFNDCISALKKSSPVLFRIKTSCLLQKKMQANAREPVLKDVLIKGWRRGVIAIRRRISKSIPKYQFESGGAMIAIIGGDGSGKSTSIISLIQWLSGFISTSTIHMGKPAWSLPTIMIRSGLKVGQLLGLYPLETSFDETIQQKSILSPGYPFLIREVCTARDRYRNYVRARRLAEKGVVVFLDRFPNHRIKLMDGPQTRRFINTLSESPQSDVFFAPKANHRLAKLLVKLEENFYRQITSPEVTILLRVHPDIAVQRKTEEDPAMVRKRSNEIWEIDWTGEPIYILDASKSVSVLHSIQKSIIWSEL